MKKIVILNDTTRDLGHIGCQLVMQNIKKLCEMEHGEILFCDKECREFDKKDFQYKIKNADMVILNGEGTLHDDAGTIWLQKAQVAKECNKNVFLVNSVWQNNLINKKYLQVFDLCSFRESLSYKAAIDDGALNSYRIPDLSFYSFNSLPVLDVKSKNLMLVDSTLNHITKQIIKYGYQINEDVFFMYEKRRRRFERNLKYRFFNMLYNKKFRLLQSVEQIASHKVMLSGRFHACCIGMMLQVPSFAIESNTWKIQGVYQDADIDNKFIAKNVPEILIKMSEVTEKDYTEYRERSYYYCQSAHKTIQEFWRDILD